MTRIIFQIKRKKRVFRKNLNFLKLTQYFKEATFSFFRTTKILLTLNAYTKNPNKKDIIRKVG